MLGRQMLSLYTAEEARVNMGFIEGPKENSESWGEQIRYLRYKTLQRKGNWNLVVSRKSEILKGVK